MIARGATDRPGPVLFLPVCCRKRNANPKSHAVRAPVGTRLPVTANCEAATETRTHSGRGVEEIQAEKARTSTVIPCTAEVRLASQKRNTRAEAMVARGATDRPGPVLFLPVCCRKRNANPKSHAVRAPVGTRLPVTASCEAATDIGIRVGRRISIIQAEKARTSTVIPTTAEVRLASHIQSSLLCCGRPGPLCEPPPAVPALTSVSNFLSHAPKSPPTSSTIRDQSP